MSSLHHRRIQSGVFISGRIPRGILRFEMSIQVHYRRRRLPLFAPGMLECSTSSQATGLDPNHPCLPSINIGLLIAIGVGQIGSVWVPTLFWRSCHFVVLPLLRSDTTAYMDTMSLTCPVLSRLLGLLDPPPGWDPYMGVCPSSVCR